ncbi:DUF805 domain-containing protein [uncultured Hyphomicrobium sp.]|uniref:DUF805 domain-containing protein n=1 Tax=uncultured Hyphomicrobium sp. TaxID=194373 RepID=UPI0025D22F64|nr:DUF805 domain-containing protein [uncultured Hyphomicrobium sp.]
MRLLPLLTTFRGRISRKPWWIGLIVFAVLNIGGGLILNPEYFTAEDIPPANVPDTIWQLMLLFPLTAITVKRCNDRDWPSWVAPASTAANALNLVAPYAGFEIGFGARGAGGVVFWIIAVIVLAVVIDNGFVRGADGPNRHGPDPLALA